MTEKECAVVWVTWGKKQTDTLRLSIKRAIKHMPWADPVVITSCDDPGLGLPDGVGPVRMIQPEHGFSGNRSRAGVIHESWDDIGYDWVLTMDTDAIACCDMDFLEVVGTLCHVSYDIPQVSACIEVASKTDWQLPLDHDEPPLIQYNAGFVLGNEPLFESWGIENRRLDKSNRMCATDDQYALAVAVEECDRVSTLPREYNFRAEYHRDGYGPIRVWHDHTIPPYWAGLLPRTMWRWDGDLNHSPKFRADQPPYCGWDAYLQYYGRATGGSILFDGEYDRGVPLFSLGERPAK